MNGAKPRQVVDAVRWVMDGVIRDKAQSTAIAKQYLELVDDARRRSSECLQLIRDGLRAEAREQALRAPSLMDVLAALHDPALARWPEFCQRFGLPVPSSLSAREVEELQEGMRALDQIGPLLTEWRIQNLRRDPVHVRLQTLWRLSRADKTSPHWREDAHRFEASAREELAEHYQRNLTLGKLDECWRLQQFLSKKEWTDPTALALSKRWATELLEHMPRTAHERALEVARLLHERFLEQDLAGASEHARRFETLKAFLSDTAAALPGEVSNEAEAAIRWIEQSQRQEERRRDASARLAALNALLAMQTSERADIEAALHAVEEIPPEEPWDDTFAAAHARIAQALARERRARAMKWLTASAAVIVLGAFAAWGIAAYRAATDAQSMAERLTALVEQGRLADADEVLASGRALGLHEYEEMSAAADLLAAAQEARKRDEQRFEVLMAEAGDPSARGARLRAVEEAEQLAFTAAQRERVAAWRESFAAAATTRQRERDAAFTQRVGELSEQLTVLAKAGPAQAGGKRALEAIEAQLRVLRAEADISAPARDAATPLRQRVERLRAEWDAVEAERGRSAEREADYARLQEAAGDPASYASALRRFAERWPEDPRAASCRQAAANDVAWAVIADWSARMQPFTGKPMPTDRATREKLSDAAAEHLSAYPLSPFRNQASYLSVALRPGSDLFDWCESVIRRPLMQLGELRLKDGKRYPILLNDALSTHVGTTAIVRIVPSRDEIDKPESRSFSLDTIVHEGESPQGLMARRADEVLGDTSLSAEERAIRLWAILTADESVEPLLRVALAEAFLERAPGVLPASAERWEATARTIEEANVPDVDWIAPATAATQAARRKATAALAGAPSAHDLRQEVAAAQLSAARAVASRFTPVGRVVLADGSKKIAWLPNANASRTGTVVAVVAGASEPVAIIEVSDATLHAIPAEALLFAVDGGVAGAAGPRTKDARP